VEFGRHIDKGLWAAADKLLPVIYGVTFVLLVVRVLPQGEYGSFVLIQDIFLTITGLATALALQPMLKYAAEHASDSDAITRAGAILFILFNIVLVAAIFLSRSVLGNVFNSPAFPGLVLLLPLLVLSSFPRSIALILLQADLKIKQIFLVDAVHFLGAPIAILVWSQVSSFRTASDILHITIATQAASSVLAIALTRPRWPVATPISRESWRKLWRYGTYTLGSALGSLTGARADTFLLSTFGGMEQVALYNSAKIFLRAYDMVAQVIQMLIVPATSSISARGDKVSLLALIEKSILFGTIAILPLFVGYTFFPELLIRILYHGRYLDAVPVLMVLGLPALIIPAQSIAGTALLGLGRARSSFVLGMTTVTLNLCFYLVLIPRFGAVGAAWGAALSSFAIGAMALVMLRKDVPYTPGGILSRVHDIKRFVAARLQRRPR